MTRLCYLIACLVLSCVAWLVTRGEAPEPWDHALLLGQPADTVHLSETEPGVFCVWTVRAGVRYRVPAAAAPYVDVTTDPRLYGTPVPLPGAHLCYLIEPTGSRT